MYYIVCYIFIWRLYDVKMDGLQVSSAIVSKVSFFQKRIQQQVYEFEALALNIASKY